MIVFINVMNCDSCLFSKYIINHVLEIHFTFVLLFLGANPFRCDYCSQRFSDNSSLKYHVMFNHSGETLYQCSTCTAKFTSNKEYNKHLQKCGKPTTAASDTDDSVLYVTEGGGGGGGVKGYSKNCHSTELCHAVA